MDTMLALKMAQANRDSEMKVFDWDKAAKILLERGAKDASAGLSQDWKGTSDDILADGKIPEEHDTYLSSCWATPELFIDGEYIDCFVMGSETHWDSGTWWPDSAKKIMAFEA